VFNATVTVTVTYGHDILFNLYVRSVLLWVNKVLLLLL
jgi:hypothetical protein